MRGYEVEKQNHVKQLGIEINSGRTKAIKLDSIAAAEVLQHLAKFLSTLGISAIFKMKELKSSKLSAA